LLHKEGTADGPNDSSRNPGIDRNWLKTRKGNSDAIKSCGNDTMDFHGDSRDSAKAGGKKKGRATPSGEGLLHKEGTADGPNDSSCDPGIDGNPPKMRKGNSDAIKGRGDNATDFHGDSRDSAKAGGKKKKRMTPSGEGLLHEEGTTDGHNDSTCNPGIDRNQPKTCKGNSDAIKGRDNDATATANGHNDSLPNRRIDGKHANTGGNDLRSGKGDAIKSCADNGRVCHAAQPREEDKQPAKKL